MIEGLLIGALAGNKVVVPLCLLEPARRPELEYVLAYWMARHALRHVQERKSQYQELTTINIGIFCTLAAYLDWRLIGGQLLTIPLYSWWKGFGNKKSDVEAGRLLMSILDRAACDTGAVLAHVKTIPQREVVGRVVEGMEKTQHAIGVRDGLEDSKSRLIDE